MSVPLGFSIFAVLLGLVLGSFGNVLIFRLPEGKSIGGRSRCPHCKRTLGIIDLVPVLSFLLLRARCRTCRGAISFQYPLVELASGLLFLYAFQAAFTAPSPHAFVMAALLVVSLWLLLLIAVTDARTSLIPDALSVPLVLCAFLRAALFWSPVPHDLWPVFPFLLLQGAVISAGFFALQWLVSRGRWVGSGDIILAAGIGFLLMDPSLVIVAIGLAYILGAAFACMLLLMGRATRKTQVPFGPFLAAGTFITILFGENILARLLGP